MEQASTPKEHQRHQRNGRGRADRSPTGGGGLQAAWAVAAGEGGAIGTTGGGDRVHHGAHSLWEEAGKRRGG